MIPNERMLPKQIKAEQTEVVVQCTSGTAINQATLYLQEGYYLNSIQLQNVNTSPLLIWVEYFYDRNESTKGEILDLWWARNTLGLGYSPTKIINKLIAKELSKIVFNVLNESGTDETAIFVVTYSEEAITQTSTYDWENDRGVWAYNDMIERHTSGGVLAFTITPVAGSWFDIETISLTMGMTAAEDIQVEIQDVNGDALQLLMFDNTDTGELFGPNQMVHVGTEVATTPSTVGKKQDKIRVHYPDYLSFATSAASATDDILIRIRAKLKDRIPTIGYGTNTLPQAAYTDDFNKVI